MGLGEQSGDEAEWGKRGEGACDNGVGNGGKAHHPRLQTRGGGRGMGGEVACDGVGMNGVGERIERTCDNGVEEVGNSQHPRERGRNGEASGFVTDWG